MAIKLSKAETLSVVNALRHHADTLATTMERALAELGKDAQTKMPAVYNMIMSSNTGANDLRELAKKIEEYGPGAKPGKKPKVANAG